MMIENERYEIIKYYGENNEYTLIKTESQPLAPQLVKTYTLNPLLNLGNIRANKIKAGIRKAQLAVRNLEGEYLIISNN